MPADDSGRFARPDEPDDVPQRAAVDLATAEAALLQVRNWTQQQIMAARQGDSSRLAELQAQYAAIVADHEALDDSDDDDEVAAIGARYTARAKELGLQ
ncbi:hypothetical protein [Streptomyces sp. NBC_01304]|uniref:hypothetical protein n=1 Tax=Streptomyces sp. NBC_01304 TaxID=2903818 RepID=UPI002E127493|nr:hypothetical protein OG430_49225 [Streptomyces sp. NBC_01304]